MLETFKKLVFLSAFKAENKLNYKKETPFIFFTSE